jgi:hypothetical protein
MCAIAALQLVLLVSSGAVQAQQSAASALNSTGFLANPDQILVRNPNGGARLIEEVRGLAISDPATLQPILGLLPKANKDQTAAIAVGLAEAAKLFVRTNPKYAIEIQLAVDRTRNQELILVYEAETREQTTPATAGRGGQFGGGVAGRSSQPIEATAGISAKGSEQMGGYRTITPGIFPVAAGAGNSEGAFGNYVSFAPSIAATTTAPVPSVAIESVSPPLTSAVESVSPLASVETELTSTSVSQSVSPPASGLLTSVVSQSVSPLTTVPLTSVVTPSVRSLPSVSQSVSPF